MADFNTAYRLTKEDNEGGYDNNPNDTGGETIDGVSRNNFPNWAGWPTVDAEKAKGGDFYARLRINNEFQALIKAWYKAEFWDKMKLDDMKYQALANELFDTGVNMNWPRAAEFLQISLNAFNRQGKDYKDIVEDGDIGRNTLIALEAYMEKRNDLPTLLKALNCLQGAKYIDLSRGRQANEEFAYGWVKNRISL